MRKYEYFSIFFDIILPFLVSGEEELKSFDESAEKFMNLSLDCCMTKVLYIKSELFYISLFIYKGNREFKAQCMHTINNNG